MKKIIALLLVAVMCFALVACNNNSDSNSDVEKAKAEILGEWKTSELGGVSFTFNEDGTGTYSDKPMKWKFDEELTSYIICESSGQMMCVTNIEADENGNQYFKLIGVKIYRVDK